MLQLLHIFVTHTPGLMKIKHCTNSFGHVRVVVISTTTINSCLSCNFPHNFLWLNLVCY